MKLQGTEGRPEQQRRGCLHHNLARYFGKYFELANDITYPHTTAWDDDTSQEDNFTAIGNSSTKHFDGTFDGKGHTVSGIRIYKPADPYQGLFGYLGGTVAT